MGTVQRIYASSKKQNFQVTILLMSSLVYIKYVFWVFNSSMSYLHNKARNWLLNYNYHFNTIRDKFNFNHMYTPGWVCKPVQAKYFMHISRVVAREIESKYPKINFNTSPTSSFCEYYSIQILTLLWR